MNKFDNWYDRQPFDRLVVMGVMFFLVFIPALSMGLGMLIGHIVS